MIHVIVAKMTEARTARRQTKSRRGRNPEAAFKQTRRRSDEISMTRYRKLKSTALGKPGDDLLSRALRHSTIGAGAFHGRVRDGIGCGRSASITRPTKGSDTSGPTCPVSIVLASCAQGARSAIAQ